MQSGAGYKCCRLAARTGTGIHPCSLTPAGADGARQKGTGQRPPCPERISQQRLRCLLALVWSKRFAAAVVSPHWRDSGQLHPLRGFFPLHSVSETVAVLFWAIRNVVSNLLTALGFVYVHQREVRRSVVNTR